MTQQSETVLVPQTLEELQNSKVKDLRAVVAVLKSEDTDCLPDITSKSKKSEMVDALSEYMGFTNSEVEEKALSEQMEGGLSTEQVEQLMDDPRVTEGGEDPHVLAELGGFEPTPSEEGTGDEEVDSVLAELGLDGTDSVNADDILFSDQPSGVTEDDEIPSVDVAPENEPQAEEKPKKKRGGITIQNGPRIPIRHYEGLVLGVYGDILEPLEEKDENGYEYDLVKLERFNGKAHEQFRKTKGHTILLFTSIGASYLVAKVTPEGEYEPIIEVTNKGRGHLRCRQYANVLHLAYNEKNDIQQIDSETYSELAEKIELLEIKWEGLGA